MTTFQLVKNNFKYLPFLTGNYSTAPGLKALSFADHSFDQKVFQIDDQYEVYLKNKTACRNENLKKYYLESHLKGQTVETVSRFIIDQLCHDYPENFSQDEQSLKNRLNGQRIDLTQNGSVNNPPYISQFDALSNQVQEDMAIFQLTDDADYLAAIHLCAPNHWSPADKIGKPFDTIHQPVAEMGKMLKNYRIMLESIVQKGGPYTRFAWGLATDDRLNHHPDAPPQITNSDWNGRTQESSDLYLRVERQNLVGFPTVNAILFTIRTYHYRVDELTTFEKSKLKEAIDSMTEATKKYKGIDRMMGLIERM